MVIYLVKIGIVGSGEDKFTSIAKQNSIRLIERLLKNACNVECFVSGHSHLGGVDIWSEEIAIQLGIKTDIKIPKQLTWNDDYGYKQRNIDIAKSSDIVYVIVPDDYPNGYNGLRFPRCYHCHVNTHIKSGACWTAHKAISLGKLAKWYVISNQSGDIIG